MNADGRRGGMVLFEVRLEFKTASKWIASIR